MSNYEGKLGEWLKYVQQQVEAIGKPNKGPEEEEAKPEAQAEQPREEPERIAMSDRLARVLPEETTELDSASVIADSSLLQDQPEVRNRRANVFDETDVPNVEDYLPFLKESERIPEPSVSDRGPMMPPPVVERASEIEIPEDEELLLFEGTGEPKPMIRGPEPPPVAEQKAAEVPVKSEAPREVRKPILPPAHPDAAEVRELWDRLPRHIQLLVGQAQQEVAQNSYKKFKETREEMVARLLDPTLSLEETARILNVCPTTVRRYTNRGALRHLRTAGNQRRFRLSDVLAFLESQAAGPDGGHAAESDITGTTLPACG